MGENFSDLIEPIELLQPSGLYSELVLAQQSSKITCNLGYLCNGGEMEIPD
jgi:hypothetical protein